MLPVLSCCWWSQWRSRSNCLSALIRREKSKATSPGTIGCEGSLLCGLNVPVRAGWGLKSILMERRFEAKKCRKVRLFHISIAKHHVAMFTWLVWILLSVANVDSRVALECCLLLSVSLCPALSLYDHPVFMSLLVGVLLAVRHWASSQSLSSLLRASRCQASIWNSVMSVSRHRKCSLAEHLTGLCRHVSNPFHLYEPCEKLIYNIYSNIDKWHSPLEWWLCVFHNHWQSTAFFYNIIGIRFYSVAMIFWKMRLFHVLWDKMKWFKLL